MIGLKLLSALCLIITSFTFLMPAPLCAVELSREEREYLRQKGTIVFVSQTRYPPFEFVDAEGQHEGMMLDIARWMAVEMGFKPVFIDMTFKDAQEAVLSGKADVITSLFYSDKRSERFDFTATLFEVPASIFIRAERTDIKGLDDLAGKTIAIQKGDYAREFLESKKMPVTILDTKDFAEATDMVIARKADAVIGDEQIVYYHIYSSHLTDKVKKVGEPLYTGRNCMASKKGNAVLAGILARGVAEARRSGIATKISTKWLGTVPGSSDSFFERHSLVFAAGAGGLVILLLLAWAYTLHLRILVRKKTEAILQRDEGLRDSARRYDRLASNIPVGVYLLYTSPRGEYAFRYVSPRMAEIIGVNAEDVLTDPEIAFAPVHPDDIMAFRSLNRERIEARQPFLWEGRAIVKGRLVWLRIESQPEPQDDGSVMWNGVISDITLRKEAEEASRESRERFRALVETMYDLIWEVNTRNEYTYVSPRVRGILGYTPDELIGRTPFDFMVPEEAAAKTIVIRDLAVREKPIVALRNTFVHKDGHRVVLETNGRPFYDAAGNPGGYRGTDRDVTERKRIEEELRENEAMQRTLLSNLPAGVVIIDPAMKIIENVNNAAVEMLGLSEDQIIGRRCHRFMCPAEEGRCPVSDLGHDVDSAEREMICADGSIRPILKTVRRIRIKGRDKLLECFIDLTERKEMERELRDSREALNSLINATNESLILTDTDGRIRVANEVVARRMGKSTRELMGTSLFESLPPDVGSLVRERYGELVLTEKSAAFKDKRNNRDYETFLYPVVDVTGAVSKVAVFMKDVTDRKHMEDLLAESEDKFRALAEKSFVGIYLIQDGLFRYVNERFSEMAGYSVEEIVDRMGPLDMAYSEDISLVEEQVKRRISGAVNSLNYEFRMVTKSGQVRTVEIFSSRTIYGGKPSIIGTIIDITDRKENEEKLKHLTIHDPLTGVHNRFMFEEELRRFGTGRFDAVGIVICDLDGLKMVNDTLGHEVGDRQLTAAGNLLKDHFRSSDIVARIGGDEFAILIANCSAENITEICERLKEALADKVIPGTDIPLMMSIGYVSGNAAEYPIEELVKNADANMYEQKKRNRPEFLTRFERVVSHRTR